MKHVRESYNQREKLEKIVADYNGKEIKPSRRVAFNYQGSVRLGTIIELKNLNEKIQLSQKKKELEEYESRLDKLVSPEIREQLELEAIQKGLGL